MRLRWPEDFELYYYSESLKTLPNSNRKPY
jgi:hypothetical protein